jgi:uncharacterized membrane protein (DUF4010 family)
MKKELKNLLIFFASTLVWTWVFYAPMAAGGHNPYEMPWAVLLILGCSFTSHRILQVSCLHLFPSGWLCL